MIRRREFMRLLAALAGGAVLALLLMASPFVQPARPAADCPISGMGVPRWVWGQVRQVADDLARLKSAIEAPQISPADKTRLGQAVDRDRQFLARILACEGNP